MERNSILSPDGARIVWTTIGAGDGVVICPGSLSDGSDWFDLAERIKDALTVHVMTRRGLGDSGDGPEYAVEREYEDIVAVLKATGSTRLVGHSYGAICALGAALLHPDLDRLVAYEPPLNIGEPVVPADALADVEAAVDRGDVESTIDIGLRRCVRLPDGEVDELKTIPIWQDLVRHGTTWPRELRVVHEKAMGVEEYAAISVPTLLPVGEATPQHHRVAAEALLAVMPDARLVNIAGTGHEGQLEAPEQLARELTEFLR
jgi:pimeloyl-ACP methyl ester carboxylesterase